MGNDQTAYDDAKNDEKIYNEQLNEQKAKTHYELNEEDKQKLKKAYRKASQICHPDRVNDEQKDIAQAVFVQLTKAYEENDLKKVEEILADLQKGVFKARSESVSQSDKLYQPNPKYDTIPTQPYIINKSQWHTHKTTDK